MLRDEGFRPRTRTVNLVLMNGGVGDHIASLVAIDYCIKQYPWITYLAWMPDFLVEFAKHLLPKHLSIRGFSEMRGRYEPSKPTKTTRWDGATSPMKIHLLDYAFMKLADENPGLEHKNYLQIDHKEIDISPFNLPKRYVVITTCYTAKVREFLPSEINKIADFLLLKGVTPVFLGQTETKTGAAHVIQGAFSEEIAFDRGLNLIDKTSLLEASAIMHYSRATIGVDNGLMHVAGCTRSPIVGGFTTVTPETRWPVRGNTLGLNCYPVAPEVTLKCRFCQEKTNFLYGHDYKTCIYEDLLCTTHMKAEKFIAHLKRLI